MREPQKRGGAEIYQAFDPAGIPRWTCWQAADGETTRGWGQTPNAAYKDWLFRTLIAEGLSYRKALTRVREDNYA